MTEEQRSKFTLEELEQFEHINPFWAAERALDMKWDEIERRVRSWKEKKVCSHPNHHWIGRPWSGVHKCDDCGEEFPVGDIQKRQDIIGADSMGDI